MDEIVVHYPSPFELMQDLQTMAENNAIIQRQSVLSRDVLMATAAIYKGIMYRVTFITITVYI
jgi:NADH dehydrogenase [ubiquinone] 1 alpha subcomplex assembly factor 5